MKRSWVCWLVLPVLWSASGVEAEEFDAAKVKVAIQGHDSGAQVGAVEASPVRGMYLTTIDGVSGYVSADGRYFVVGDMLDLASRTNVTEEKKKAKTRELLKQIGPGEAIVFGAAKARYSITVFTDADCPYCRKLHGEIGELEKKGVEVRYVAFPRSGPGTKSWQTMTAVWCAKDRNEALERAIRGNELKAEKKCSDGVIAKHYELGQKLGIPGTPMIVLRDGTSLGGYLEPDKLVMALAEHAGRAGGTSHVPF